MGSSRAITTLRRLLRAAPGAFRRDPLFRYAAIGAVVSFLVLLVRLGGGDEPGSSAGPLSPPAPQALGSSYGATDAAAPSPSPPPASAAPSRIAPGRPLDGVRIAPDSSAADRFGVAPGSSPRP